MYLYLAFLVTLGLLEDLDHLAMWDPRVTQGLLDLMEIMVQTVHTGLEENQVTMADHCRALKVMRGTRVNQGLRGLRRSSSLQTFSTPKEARGIKGFLDHVDPEA